MEASSDILLKLPSSLYWPLLSTAERWMKTACTNGFSWELVSLLSSWQRMQVSARGGGVWSNSETTPTAHRGGGSFRTSWSASLQFNPLSISISTLYTQYFADSAAANQLSQQKFNRTHTLEWHSPLFSDCHVYLLQLLLVGVEEPPLHGWDLCHQPFSLLHRQLLLLLRDLVKRREVQRIPQSLIGADTTVATRSDSLWAVGGVDLRGRTRTVFFSRAKVLDDPREKRKVLFSVGTVQ